MIGDGRRGRAWDWQVVQKECREQAGLASVGKMVCEGTDRQV